MVRCNEVTRLHASEELRFASWRKRLAVRLHLLMCRSCQRYVKELSLIGEAAREAAQESPDDEELLESIVQRVLPKNPDPDR